MAVTILDPFLQKNPQAARALGTIGGAINKVNQWAAPITGSGTALLGDVGNKLQTMGGYFGKMNPINPPSVGAQAPEVQWRLDTTGLMYDSATGQWVKDPRVSTGGSSQVQTKTPIVKNDGVFRGDGGSGDGGLSGLKDNELSAIQAEYDQEMARLGQLEATTRGQYGEAEQRAKERYPETTGLIEKERAGRLGELDTMKLQRQQESQSALGKARNLLNELQRRQQAYMSATGNYGGSTQEALGEQFGRQAFQSIGDIQKQRDLALKQVEDERVKTQNFYSTKLMEAKRSFEDQLSSLNQQLLGALDQINSAKGQAESAKRAASLDVWKQYTANKINLQQQEKAREDSLAQWLMTMQANLEQAKAYKTGDVSGLDFGNIWNNLNTSLGQIGQTAQSAPNIFSRVLPRYDTKEDEWLRAQS